MTIRSTITESENVILERKIPSSLIIEVYKNNLDVDVRRFFKGIEYVDIYKCLDTGYRFYYPLMLAGDDLFYQELEKFPWYYSDWKWEHALAYTLIEKDSTVLEIGCANGSFIKKLKEKGVTAEGLEMNSKAQKKCLAAGLSVYSDSIEKFSENKESSFDVVCSFQVLEHIAEVRSFIAASLHVLKPGGIMIVSVPNNDCMMFTGKDVDLNMPPHHMGLWNMNALMKLQNHFDMKIESLYLEPLRKEHVSAAQTRIEELCNRRMKHFLGFQLPYVAKVYKHLAYFSALALAPYISGHSVVAVFKKNH